MAPGSSWRRDLFHEFYREKGMTIAPNMLVDCELSVSSTSSLVYARKTMEGFLSQDYLPTAIFASNDILGLAALQVANDKGIKVPSQLSIVGMDGIFSGEVSYPPLTTVKKNRAEIGRMAAQTLIEKIKNQHDWQIRRLVLPCKLIERGSTGPV